MGREPGYDVAGFVEGDVIYDEAGDLTLASDGDELLFIEGVLDVFEGDLLIDPFEIVDDLVAVVAPWGVVEGKGGIFYRLLGYLAGYFLGMYRKD